jgi:hypothetical protein
MNIEYLEVSTAFIILGCHVFALYRWWYRRLTILAERYDVAERRQRAARRFPLVILCLMIPMGGVLVGSIRLTKVDNVFILAALVFCVAPGFIWWAQRMRKIYELGYGRRR